MTDLLENSMAEDSDLHPSVNDFVSLYDAIAVRRGLSFARDVYRNTVSRKSLGYSTMKSTLETTVALLEKHPTNGHLDRLPAVVESIYGLTPEMAKTLRINFLNEVKSMAHLDMCDIEARAQTYYCPAHADICEYVVGLSFEEKTLIVQSEKLSWDELGQRYSKYKAHAAHFARLEKQFNVTLRDYLPQSPSSQSSS